MNTRFTTLKSVLLLGFIIMIQACATEGDSAHQESSKPVMYKPVDDPMLEVQTTLNKAKQNNKLALIILGAQWCHDSTGLVEKFASSEMQALLNENFETVFIDVGYFQDRRDITQRFGQAHYFATPTVFVVDPSTEKLLNADTLQKWGSADSVPLDEYVEYFAGFDDISQFQSTPISQDHAKLIRQFEHAQSERLMGAYIVLRPDLKIDAQRAPNTDYSEQFVKRWRELKTFRIQLQKDIQQLYFQAKNAGEAPLELPVYEKFSWE